MGLEQQISMRRDNMTAELEQAVIDACDIVGKNYLERLSSLEVIPPDRNVTDINVAECGRFFHLERLIINKDEDFLDKLPTIANSVAPLGCSLVTIIDSDGEKIDYYIGVVSKQARQDNENDKAIRQAGADTFSGAVEGNFSGSTLHMLDKDETVGLCRKMFEPHKSIASISGIVSLRNKDSQTPGAYVQGLENLTNSLRGKTYTIIMIADAVTSSQIRTVKHGYELIYSQLSHLRTTSYTSNESDAFSLSETQTEGITTGINEGITRSQFRSTSNSQNSGTSVGFSINPFNLFGVSYNKSSSHSTGSTVGFSNAESTQHSRTTSQSRASSSGSVKEHSNSIQLNVENRTVKGLLDKIDLYLERLDACESYGAFECAAYVLADCREDALSAAGHYNALMRGDESFVQSFHVNVWPPSTRRSAQKNNDSVRLIAQYISAFSHPEFYFDAKQHNGTVVRPSSLVSGLELAVQFALPKKSVHGLAVLEMTPFGRNTPAVRGQAINIGTLYYMGRNESSLTRVLLNAGSLTSHTFVTGSTGSGKSNTIYKMIDELCPVDGNKVTFLVIEPAKGEYKEVFGGRSDVTLYGTNPFKTPNLLKMNPFSFPGGVHVLEHIDRIVEVFNACWPMYAAMPAILRESIESAYESVGWNLNLSKNPGVYPNFDTLLETLPRIIESSGYSNDTSNDYKGALITRVRSLSRGIHGQIFAGDIPAKTLFTKNAIIDLSRVGSPETKALIMGILILKLQEYRMSENADRNSELRHITVLEEAHNLLRRVSAEQSQESSNLQGKSVEMLANAIAEMRTYGEGFIIADQSPGLMDMSVIRNTNTKIIMRLPDESDRRLVGKAAGLSDSQIDELARLEKGVAAISQSDWLEPVLCKVDEFKEKHSFAKRTDTFQWEDGETTAIQQFLRTAFDIEHIKLTKDMVDKIRKWYGGLGLSEKARYLYESVLDGNKLDDRQKMLLIYYAVGGALKEITVCEDAVSKVSQMFTGKYGFNEDDEVFRYIDGLFLSNFPANIALDRNIEKPESFGGADNLL